VLKARRTRGLNLVLPLAFLACLLCAPLQGEAKIAEANLSSLGVTLQLVVPHAGGTLSVSGPQGLMQTGSFDKGESPSFSLTGQKGGMAADGQYTYEVRINPVLSDAQREQLAAGRDSGASQALIARWQEAGLIPAELAQTGYFQVVGGAVVTASELEPALSAASPDFAQATTATIAPVGTAPEFDQQILDDLIVDGSACIGQDCVNGESFGFDTIRLKENNLRIRFQDTSNSASFPTRDWQITANDSSNGGANKFSIDDIDGGRTPFTVEAGARTNALYVEADGDIGFGTANPVVDLHVVQGNTPTLRLEQDGSSGFTPQTWDVAGNEANFFVRDATNGSELVFRIQPGAPQDSLHIASTGKVGLGTSSPSTSLHIKGSNPVFSLEENGQDRWVFRTKDNQFRISKTGTSREFQIDADGTVWMGANGNAYFKLTPTGDLYISGKIYSNNKEVMTY